MPLVLVDTDEMMEAVDAIRNEIALSKIDRGFITTELNILTSHLNKGKEEEVLWLPMKRQNKILDEYASVLGEANNFPLSYLKTKTNLAEVVKKRQLFMFFAKHCLNGVVSLKNVGNFCGGKKHDIVCYSANTLLERLQTKDEETMIEVKKGIEALVLNKMSLGRLLQIKEVKRLL
jgi:chromosomal replication initiation ATPase DnaA